MNKLQLWSAQTCLRFVMAATRPRTPKKFVAQCSCSFVFFVVEFQNK